MMAQFHLGVPKSRHAHFRGTGTGIPQQSATMISIFKKVSDGAPLVLVAYADFNSASTQSV